MQCDMLLRYMSSDMYCRGVTDSDSDPSVERIAAALARLRGPFGGWRGGQGPFGGRFGPPGFSPHRDGHAPHDPRDGRGSHRARGGAGADRGHGGPFGHDGSHGYDGRHGQRGAPPWAGGDRGPLGRIAARVRLLDALAAEPTPLSVSEIAERIGVDQPRASRLVQAGVESGHLRREADPGDARRTNVVLTDEGRALVAQTRTAQSSAVEAALADFTDAEREQLAALLAKLAEAWPR